jgi:hypothetical protein
MSLFNYGLTPLEFMAASYLIQHPGRHTFDEVGEVLGVHRTTAGKAVREAVRKGALVKVGASRYASPEPDEYVPVMIQPSAERAPTLEKGALTLEKRAPTLVSCSSIKERVELRDSSRGPNGPLQSAGAALGGTDEKETKPMDDITPGKIYTSVDLSKRAAARATVRRKSNKFYRLEPVDTWTVENLVTEVVLRTKGVYATPFTGKTRELTIAFHTVHKEGVSIQTMYDGIVAYFNNPPGEIPSDRDRDRMILAKIKDLHNSKVQAEVVPDADDFYTHPAVRAFLGSEGVE